jgi:hypothetical protein
MNAFDVLDRATRAFLRPDRDSLGVAQQPSRDLSGCEQYNGREYAVLRNVRGVLAVYRVLGDGKLRRLHRWPTAIAA